MSSRDLGWRYIPPGLGGKLLVLRRKNHHRGSNDDLEEGEIREELTDRESAPSYSSLSDIDSDPGYDSEHY